MVSQKNKSWTVFNIFLDVLVGQSGLRGNGTLYKFVTPSVYDFVRRVQKVMWSISNYFRGISFLLVNTI
jgi:hypothetical protein